MLKKLLEDCLAHAGTHLSFSKPYPKYTLLSTPLVVGLKGEITVGWSVRVLETRGDDFKVLIAVDHQAPSNDELEDVVLTMVLKQLVLLGLIEVSNVVKNMESLKQKPDERKP